MSDELKISNGDLDVNLCIDFDSGIGIKRVYRNDHGELVFVLTNDTEYALGDIDGTMMRVRYDTDDNGVVDKAERLQVPVKIGNADFDGSEGVTVKDMGAAPTNHASVTQEYGIGNENEYGHVRLTDALDGVDGQYQGYAASPYALGLVNDKANKAQAAADLAREIGDAANVAAGIAQTAAENAANTAIEAASRAETAAEKATEDARQAAGSATQFAEQATTEAKTAQQMAQEAKVAADVSAKAAAASAAVAEQAAENAKGFDLATFTNEEITSVVDEAYTAVFG